MENLEKEAPKEVVKSFKLSEVDDKEVMGFVNGKGWNFSAFVRVAIKESMQRVKEGDNRDKN